MANQSLACWTPLKNPLVFGAKIDGVRDVSWLLVTDQRADNQAKWVAICYGKT